VLILAAIFHSHRFRIGVNFSRGLSDGQWRHAKAWRHCVRAGSCLPQI